MRFVAKRLRQFPVKAGAIQACRVAGHGHLDVTLLYGLDDYEKQEQAIKSNQEPFMTAGLLGATNYFPAQNSCRKFLVLMRARLGCVPSRTESRPQLC